MAPAFFVMALILSLLFYPSAVAKTVLSNIRPFSIMPGPGHGQNPGLAKGKFLVARPMLRGSRFEGTVILLTEYSVHGTMGLVLNRPLSVKAAEAVPGLKGLNGYLYWGGPVATDRVIFLFRPGVDREGARRVFDKIYVGSSFELLKEILEEGAAEDIRLYAGYSGWAPGQLESEIARGAWKVTEADASVVFRERAPGLMVKQHPGAAASSSLRHPLSSGLSRLE